MNKFKILCFLYLYSVGFLAKTGRSVVCDHQVFCSGQILHEVQMNSLYRDSKTFVDMKLKMPKQTVLKSFDTFLQLSNSRVSAEHLRNFIEEHFDDVANEFEPCIPSDFEVEPKFLSAIRDVKLETFAKEIHWMWPLLARKIKTDVLLNPEHYSIIYLPKPFIVPGGRFREIYYWDTFWICKGLLLSEMHVTVKGMLENYVHLVDNYGLIPNGNRIYYTKRSQPPMLIAMVDIYHEATKDFAFVQEIFPSLEKEFEFWRRHRSVKVRKHGREYVMYRFSESSHGPRPESYREDVEDAAAFETAEEREALFRELKAAAESGWDFSSRWFVHNATGGNGGKLQDTKTSYIVPVDLNSVVERNARTMARFCKEMGLRDKARYFTKLSRDLQRAIRKVLWQEAIGAWLDYDFVNKEARNSFYPSNLAPMWTKSYHSRDTEYYVTRVLKYLAKVNVLGYPGGIPTSQVENTGQQWDYPNAWAPLQDIVITGLYESNHEEAMKLAVMLAQNWIATNYVAFEVSCAMHEKYDARFVGTPGHGGEYENQVGFGWTNGVALDLMYRFGDKLAAPKFRGTVIQYGGITEPRENMSASAQEHSENMFEIDMDEL